MSSPLDTFLRPVHQWVWGDFDRRVRKLLAFAEVETDGGRDILRASELTPDPLLRRLYLEHAIDELHHGVLFRERGRGAPSRSAPHDRRRCSPATRCPAATASTISASKASPIIACSRFFTSRKNPPPDDSRSIGDLVDDDPATRAIFEQILRDEVFHMNYTYTQLARVSPKSYRWQIWRARRSRLWKRYLRMAAALADVIGTVMIALVYFVVLPPFAWVAKRAHRREAAGWSPRGPGRATRRRASIDMKILGISAHYHDSAAALVVDGLPVCAVQEERLSRRKNDAGVPAGAIDWCLDHAKLEPDDLDAVVFYERRCSSSSAS